MKVDDVAGRSDITDYVAGKNSDSKVGTWRSNVRFRRLRSYRLLETNSTRWVHLCLWI